MPKVTVNVILAAVALLCLIIATGCTGGSTIDQCPLFTEEDCETLTLGPYYWRLHPRLRPRHFIFIVEFFLMALTIALICLRAFGQPMTFMVDMGILGLCLIFTFIIACVETWYASGDAFQFNRVDDPRTYYAVGGCWAAAAFFLWATFVLYAVDLALVIRA